jgi:hypothetical protein
MERSKAIGDGLTFASSEAEAGQLLGQLAHLALLCIILAIASPIAVRAVVLTLVLVHRVVILRRTGFGASTQVGVDAGVHPGVARHGRRHGANRVAACGAVDARAAVQLARLAHARRQARTPAQRQRLSVRGRARRPGRGVVAAARGAAEAAVPAGAGLAGTL